MRALQTVPNHNCAGVINTKMSSSESHSSKSSSGLHYGTSFAKFHGGKIKLPFHMFLRFVILPARCGAKGKKIASLI